MFSMPSSLLVKSVVRGYHVYQVLWEPKVREKFIVLHEQGNKHDGHAVAVYREKAPRVIVGHLPQEIAKACYFFAKHDGKITGEVTGRRVHSEEAGGLEVPCRLKFTGHSRNVKKLQELFKRLDLPIISTVS